MADFISRRPPPHALRSSPASPPAELRIGGGRAVGRVTQPVAVLLIGDRRRSRPAGLRPGLTIHLLHGGLYRRSPVSRAFPGWRASDAHAAMNEIGRSARTNVIPEQVGRRLGERSRTGPDDDPLMRSLRQESRAGGRAALVRQLLRSRGVEVSGAFPADVPGFGEADEAEIAKAALARDDERDFRARTGCRSAQAPEWPRGLPEGRTPAASGASSGPPCPPANGRGLSRRTD